MAQVAPEPGDPHGTHHSRSVGVSLFFFSIGVTVLFLFLLGTFYDQLRPRTNFRLSECTITNVNTVVRKGDLPWDSFLPTSYATVRVVEVKVEYLSIANDEPQDHEKHTTGTACAAERNDVCPLRYCIECKPAEECAARYKVGDVVPCYYDPIAVERVILSRHVYMDGVGFILVVAVTFPCILAPLLVSIRKRARRRHKREVGPRDGI